MIVLVSSTQCVYVQITTPNCQEFKHYSLTKDIFETLPGSSAGYMGVCYFKPSGTGTIVLDKDNLAYQIGTK